MIGSARSIKHVLAIFLDCRFNVMSLSRTGQEVSHSSRPVKIKKTGVNACFFNSKCAVIYYGLAPRRNAIVGAFQRFCREHLSPYA